MEYGEVVQARVDAAIKRQLEEVAKRRRVRLSEVIRLALYLFLEQEECKECERESSTNQK